MDKSVLRVGQKWFIEVEIIHLATEDSGDSIAWEDCFGHVAGGVASEFVSKAQIVTTQEPVGE